MQRTPSFRRRALEAALLAIAFAVYLYPAWDQTWLLTFQARDILRAQELLRGHLIFFGPEVTGGGHLPGGLYYYLLAVPLALGLGWKGTWLLIVVLQSITLGVIWSFFRGLAGGYLVPAFAALSFATAFAVCVGSLLLLNSTLVFLPASAVLTGLCVAYAPSSSEKSRMRALAAVFFALALGAQLHLTTLALAPPIFLLQLLGGRGGLARVRWRTFPRALVFLFPLLPFLAWRVARDFGVPLGQQPPGFAGLKGLGNFMKYSYGNFTMIYWEAHRYYGGFWFAVKAILAQLDHYLTDTGPLTWACYLVLLLWLSRLTFRLVKRKKSGPEEAPSLVLFICALCAFLPGLMTMGAGTMGVRYLGVTSLGWIFFSAAALERVVAEAIKLVPFFRWVSQGPGRPSSLALLTVFCIGGVAFYGARAPRFPQDFAKDVAFQTILPASEFEAASRHVVAQTGWTYETFRERAFLLNVFNEMTMQTNYEEVEAKVQPSAPPPDGFFVARRPTERDKAESEARLANWLIAQGVPENLAAGLQDGGIKAGPGSAFGSLIVVPYRVLNRERYPPYFQNRSEHYENTQEERIRVALAEQASAPGRTRVAEFNHCDSQSRFCRIAMVARSADLRDPLRTLTVDILGVPLSHPTQHYNPAWTEAIHEPYLSYWCGKTERKEVLAPAVGFYILDRWLLNHSFLAPYRREVRLGCAKGTRVSRLTLGFRSAQGTSHLKESQIAGQERSFELAP